MNDKWKEFLVANGAQFEQDSVANFDSIESELQAAAESDVICDLSHLDCLEVTGDDAESFLLNQFSNDIQQLDENLSQLTTYCNPKGRMFALFRVYRIEKGYILISDPGIGSSLQGRLKMFVMRSKVDIENVSDRIAMIGLSGDNAGNLLRDAIQTEPPEEVDQAVHSAELTVIRQYGAGARYLVTGVPGMLESLWLKLAEKCNPVGRTAWEWLDIQAGLPSIHDQTSEEFIPQMLNLDVLNALNFKKGCYPGQEIIARMKYLGKLKQRMFLGHIDGALPTPGDALFAEGFGTQSAGTIVSAAPAPGGGFDCLFIAQLKVIGTEALHLGSTEGPEIALRELPYQVPVEGETVA
jgi:folate-binding protein YgfZ